MQSMSMHLPIKEVTQNRNQGSWCCSFVSNTSSVLLSFKIYLESGEGAMIYSKGFSGQTLEKRNHLINLTQTMESICFRQKNLRSKTWNSNIVLRRRGTKSRWISFFTDLMDLNVLKYLSFFLKVKNIEKMRESKGGTEAIASLTNTI